MFFSKRQEVDWASKPIHSSVVQALSSADTPPYRIKAKVERCGFAAGANYGGLMITIENDGHYVSCYPTGGAQPWLALTATGDTVYMLVDHEYELRKPISNRFMAIDFINQTLESRFGLLNYKRLTNESRKWSMV
ncbi:hypothetical protein ACP3V5_17455 [Vibrio maritimus]